MNETNPVRRWWKWATTPPQSYVVYLVLLILVFVLSFYGGTMKQVSTGVGPPPAQVAPRN